MNKMRHVAISAVAIALFGLAQDPAHAFVVNIYDFNVDKATTTAGPLSTVMHDSFTDNIGLNRAGPITEPPSVLGNGIYAAPGGDFNGQSESAASAAGGYRVLDTTTGTVKPSSFPNSPGGPDYIQGATTILVTDTGPSTTAGLKSNDLIRVTGLFDLVSLTHPFEQYGIALTNNTAAALGHDALNVTVAQNALGVNVVRIRDVDFASGVIVSTAQVALTPLDLTHAMIALRVENSAADPTSFTGSFAFVDDGVLDTETFTTITGLNSTVTMFDDGNNWVQASFLANSAVPEPATLALFGAALAGLGVARRRKTA